MWARPSSAQPSLAQVAGCTDSRSKARFESMPHSYKSISFYQPVSNSLRRRKGAQPTLHCATAQA